MKKYRNNFTFIDLFAGIGGMRRGFEAVGGRCIYTSEWNKYSIQTYKANYSCNHELETGDIQNVKVNSVPNHDVLLAGFPCQPFSLAGVSKKESLGRAHGFACKAQGTLFFTIANILKEKQPGAFLLENVKNLKSHDRGNTFKIIMETLEKELNYEVHHRVIDAQGFVPQHRERIFIVGLRKDSGVSKKFDFDKLNINPFEEPPSLDEILHHGNELVDEPYTILQGGEVVVNPKYSLSEHLWGYLQDYKEKHRKKGNGFGYGLFGRDDVARTISARYHKDGAEVLIRQRGRKAPRRLTPRECARLMGFDEPGESRFVIPVSDTQAYKQFGNAVVVPVIKAIAKHMKPHILERASGPQLALNLEGLQAVNQ